MEQQSFRILNPKILPVLPLKNLVALPKSIIPVVVGRDVSIKAVEAAMQKNKEIFVTAQRSINIENPASDDIFHYGTRAFILQVARLPNGTLKILIEGIARCHIKRVNSTNGFIEAEVEDLIPEKIEREIEAKALWRSLFDLFKEYIALNEKISPDVLGAIKGTDDLDYLTDAIAVQLPLSFKERQAFLEIVDLRQRVTRLSVILSNEIEVLKTERKIKQQVQKQVEKNQKDYYLNEQIRAIHRELGREDYQKEVADLLNKMKELKLSPEAGNKAEAELKRLEQMQPTSPEATVSRHYIDWLFSIPWYKETRDDISLTEAEKILNSSHAGMQKVKERIFEFLAAKKFAGKNLKKAPILCLVGPPGVGKTSLAMSIADSLGRKLIRISLGGMRDEAEIRGHRKTYIGAMPGKIIQAMKKAQVINPLIVLDEIDKMSMDFRGDPAAALLEVLDPEQNKAFADYFVEVDYDLSRVMFITTANIIDSIPYPLLDRMEIIELSGYTEAEKMEIAQNFLLPKLLNEYCLKASQIYIKKEALRLLVDEYTKEAGVRQLERVLAKLLRKSIQSILKDNKIKKVSIDEEKLEKWLGVPRFRKPEKKKDTKPGLAVGLAWTEMGGDILEVEVSVLKGKGALTLTGQLGEVMQESAQAAMSYIRSRAKDFGLKPDFYSDLDVHVHVPEGAIPKDGPSAGITMGIALASALTKIPVKSKLAMTGEVTLRGRVLGVGGLKEKLLAASRFGVTKVLVPKENEKDIKEFEKELNSKLEITYVDSMDQVIEHALKRKPKRKSK
ncbi:MAG: endopeptidase La [bacterium]